MACYYDVEIFIRHIHSEVVHDLERDVFPAASREICAGGFYHGRGVVSAKDLRAAGEEFQDLLAACGAEIEYARIRPRKTFEKPVKIPIRQAFLMNTILIEIPMSHVLVIFKITVV